MVRRGSERREPSRLDEQRRLSTRWRETPQDIDQCLTQMANPASQPRRLAGINPAEIPSPISVLRPRAHGFAARQPGLLHLSLSLDQIPDIKYAKKAPATMPAISRTVMLEVAEKTMDRVESDLSISRTFFKVLYIACRLHDLSSFCKSHRELPGEHASTYAINLRVFLK